ncbi:hypothetical protein L1049_002022 [Liquidambar formosana]|uniref:NET domain-containing protein n=1 Tax=Liquidambar formosana TaxID=63359 RepID=A0AAP0NIH9_LIQFO
MVSDMYAFWFIWHDKQHAKIGVSLLHSFAEVLVMSEAARGLVASDEHNKVGPNYFGFYTHEVGELLSEDDYFLPASSGSFELSGEVRDIDVAGHSNNGIKANSVVSSSPLFSTGIGAGLSDFRREKLKGLLRQSVVFLTREVDEMLDPVLAIRQLRFHLRDKIRLSSCSGAASDADADADAGQSAFKKLKMSTSSSSTGVPVHASPVSCGSSKEGSGSERMNSNSNLSKKGESNTVKNICSRCHSTKTPMWRTGPEGPRVTNSSYFLCFCYMAWHHMLFIHLVVLFQTLCNACGIRLKKERESLSTKNEERESLLGSRIGAEKETEVNDDLKFLLENDRLQVEEKMKKYSDELSATLQNMEQQLEELLDTVTAKCRPMTLTEKQKLRNFIQNLPPKNLDRVVEIIRRGKMSETHSHDEIHVDLEEEDNLTLWRLYYYVKAVENARRLSMSLNENKVLL